MSGWIECPRCERQKYDRGSCNLCGNIGMLSEDAERLHCDCRADDWVEGDNGAVRCERCGGYAGEPGTSIQLSGVPVCEVLGDRQAKDFGGGKSRPSEGSAGEPDA